MYRLINPVMNKLLRSPCHRVMSKRIMVVSYRGIKSGKPYSTPVSYYRDGDNVYCFTNGVWRHNFRKGAQVTLRMKGKEHKGFARIEESDIEFKRDIMRRYFKSVPQDGKYYGVTFDGNGNPNPDQVALAATIVVMIQIALT